MRRSRHPRLASVLWLIALLITPASAAWAPRACAKEPPNPLDQGVRDGLTVKGVVVDWMVDDAERAGDPQYAASKAKMVDALTASVGEIFRYSPYGAEPVALHIRVKSFHRYEVVGDVAVVRLSDQQELGAYRKIDGFSLQTGSGGGLLGAVIGMSTAGDSTVGSANCFASRLRARFNDLKRPPCQ